MALLNLGIKIYTGSTATDASVGLDAGVVSWVTGLVGVPIGWSSLTKEGILLKNGMELPDKEIDIIDGGNLGNDTEFQFSFDNSDLKYQGHFVEAGVYLENRKLELYTITGSTPAIIWSGIIDDIQLDIGIVTIKCRSFYKERFDKKSSTYQADVNNQLTSIPITFGKNPYTYAKRIKYEEEAITINNIDTFPCTAANIDLVHYRFNVEDTTKLPSDLASGNYYIKVVAGGVEIDEYRKIEAKIIISSTIVELGVSSVFAEQLLVTGDQTFIQLIKSEIEFKIDSKKCGRYPTPTPEFFVYNSNLEEYSNLPLASFINYDENYNTIVESPTILLNRTTNSITGFKTLPFTNIIRCEESVAKTDNTTIKISSGIYKFQGSSNISVSSNTLNNLESICSDRSEGTYLEWSSVVTPTGNILYTSRAYILQATFPFLTKKFNPEKVFLGVQIKPQNIIDSIIHINLKRFSFKCSYKNSSTIGTIKDIPSGASYFWQPLIEDIPNFYSKDIGISTEYSMYDKSYYIVANSVNQVVNSITSGIKNFEIKYNGATIDKYFKFNLLDKLYITFEATAYGTATAAQGKFNLKFDELVVLLQTTEDISKNIFTNYYGRIFNNTWDSRKTASEIIEHPVDIIEAIDRQECSLTSTEIDIASYDKAGTVRGEGTSLFNFAGQILDDSKTFAQIESEICHDAFFSKTQKANGKEALKCWMNSQKWDGTTGYDNEFSFVAGDIIVGADGEDLTKNLGLTDSDRMYNQIIMKWGWNEGAQQYDTVWQIKNAAADTFPESTDITWKDYAIGFEDAEYTTARDAWLMCHQAYLRWNMVNDLPNALGEFYWVRDSGTAGALLGMGSQWWTTRKEQYEFPVPMSKNPELMDFISFTHPYYTNGIKKNGWVTRIRIDTELNAYWVQVILAPPETNVGNTNIIDQVLTHTNTIDQILTGSSIINQTI